MSQSEASMKTKKRLAKSLKKFMLSKSLNKITVTDIIKDCGVNRKTFYYHFSDIYALLKWILEQEAIDVVKSFDLTSDYEEAVLFVINYVEDNAYLLTCAYDTMGREEMKRFFYKDFNGIVKVLIDNAERETELHIDEDFKRFLTIFFAEALAGILIEYFKNPRIQNKDRFIKHLSVILKTSLPEILKNASNIQ